MFNLTAGVRIQTQLINQYYCESYIKLNFSVMFYDFAALAAGVPFHPPIWIRMHWFLAVMGRILQWLVLLLCLQKFLQKRIF